MHYVDVNLPSLANEIGDQLVVLHWHYNAIVTKHEVFVGAKTTYEMNKMNRASFNPNMPKDNCARL